MTEASDSQFAEDLPAAPAKRPLKNLPFLVLALATVATVVYLVSSSFDAQVYYYTVAEATANASDIGRDEFRLKGNVVPGSHRIDQTDLNRHYFELQADGQTATVMYDGPLPDTFVDDAEVVALGRMNAPGSFHAVEVVAKCPSRYEAQPPTASLASGN